MRAQGVEEAVSKVPELFSSVLRERRTVRTESILPGVQQQRGETGSGVVATGTGSVGGSTPSVFAGWVEAKKRAIMVRSMM
ncbi:hypothetical protein APHAL10511_000422 [Amanita phalloides]|nr:hypothetical protein APHAL10511_000422 [Amanita phalloides]